MIAPAYEEISIRLSWSVTCKLAVKAMILGVDFDGVVEIAVRDRLARMAAA